MRYSSINSYKIVFSYLVCFTKNILKLEIKPIRLYFDVNQLFFIFKTQRIFLETILELIRIKICVYALYLTFYQCLYML